MSEERWEKLDVWKLADEMAYRVYLITRSFPKEEIYGLTSQLRRAALSVPTNEDAFRREKYLKSFNGKRFLKRRLKSYLTG
jgi:four helix bundle protein